MLRPAAAFVLLLGCSRPQPPSADATPPVAVVASATSSAGTTAPQAPTPYEGTYTSAPGTLYVPEGGAWAGVTWRGDDASDGLGAGQLSIVLDVSDGRVSGKGDGALGPVVLSGVASGGVVSFAIKRADPTDGGFTGAAIGKIEGDKIDGTMHLSLAFGNVIRVATFTMSKK